MTHDSPALAPDVVSALETARSMAAAGIPIFIARSSDNKLGFQLPPAWQQIQPDPAVVDAWRPGDALCAVMGHGIDLVDADPRNGAAWPAGMARPVSYGAATTPSGGIHSFIRSLGAGSRDGVLPGIDIKGGMPDGSSRGFAFIAPTVKPSKVTGEPAPYRWVKPVDVVHAQVSTEDNSGAALALAVARARGNAGTPAVIDTGPAWYAEFATGTEAQSAPVADKAIDREVNLVATYAGGLGGGFRSALMRAAMILGGYVGAGHLDAGAAETKLKLACASVWGNADDDDARWIHQGLTDGAAKPFRVYTAADQVAGPGVDRAARWTFYDAIGPHPFDPTGDGSDQGLAEQVLDRTRLGLRAASDAGTWLLRGLDVWEETEGMAEWAVSQVARLMPVGESPVPKDHADRTPAHWQAYRRGVFMSSAGASKIAQKIKAVARGNHHACVKLAELDADPEVLWAGGTPWDLRGSLTLPKPADVDPETPHLRTASVAPCGDVQTPVWDTYLSTIWPDAEIKAWALRVLSVSLTGYADAALPILYGDERTGKSSLASLLVKLFGSYAHAADPRLLGGADTTHASVIYALKGRRLSFIDEGPRRGFLAAERLKQITGGAELTGNAMRANPITFAPTHTLLMTMNGEPDITDPALRARVRAIPCFAPIDAVRVAREALTPAVWATEAPGVLAALMRETAAWLSDPASALNASAPAVLRASMDQMAADQDPVREWQQDCTVPADPGTPGRELYHHFAAWWDAQALYRRRSIPTETAFGRSLNDLGYPVSKRTAAARYRPLSILGGRTGVMPWEPSEASGGLPGRGGSVAGTDGVPATPENPSSTPISSSVVVGMEGLSLDTTQEINNTYIPTTVETTAQIGDIPATRHTSVPFPGLTSENTVYVPATGNPPLGTTPAGPASAELARYTAELPPGQAPDVASTGLSRTELTKLKRDAAREETRATKLAEAAGAHLGLPAAVKRGEAPRAVTLDEAWAIGIEAFTRSGRLAVDVETSGFPIGHPDYALRTIQLGDAFEGIDLDATDPGSLELARRLLAEAPELNAHSATADLAPLALAGVCDYAEAFGRMTDTAILAKLADPAGTDNEPGLKKLAPAVLGTNAVTPAAEEGRAALFTAGGWITETKPTTPAARSGWLQVDPGCATMIAYAVSDVLDCAALRLALPLPAAHVLERERRVQAVTARTAHTGLALDAGLVEAQSAEREPRVAAQLAHVQALGVDNPDSPKQLTTRFTELGAAAQLGRTEKGNPSADADTLKGLQGAGGAVGELAEAVLAWRADATLLKNMIRPWSVQTRQGDGRTYPTIYTLGADTGRMSCVRPNLQQVSREGGLRECIQADPGMLLIAADFSSVEVRVAAAVSGDEALKRMVIEGVDLHSVIAAQVFGPDFTKGNRYQVKGGVFGRIYGGSVATLAKQVGVSEAVMQAVINTLDQVAAGVSAWSKQVRDAVKAGHTQYPSYSGRTIHLDPALPHKAPNYIIQGTARELLADALIKWEDGPYGGGLVLPVHDEIVAMVPAEVAEEATAYLVQCMTTEIMGVPISVEADAPSERWASAV